MEEVEDFIITSSIIVSVKDRDGRFFTQTRRIRKYRTDFYRIELLEKLVLYIEQYMPDIMQLDAEQNEIELLVGKEHGCNIMVYEYLLYSVVSMVFTLFFGGSWGDGIVSFLCGFLIKLSINILENSISNYFIVNLLASIVGALVAWFFHKIGLPISIDKVNIGNIMLLIPGLATLNSFKDLVKGETITGILRLSDALIQAVAVAFGFAVVVFFI